MQYRVHGFIAEGFPITPIICHAADPDSARAVAVARGMVVERAEADAPRPDYPCREQMTHEAEVRWVGALKGLLGVAVVVALPVLFVGWMLVCDRTDSRPRPHGMWVALVGTIRGCWWGVKAFFAGLVQLVSGQEP